MRIGVVTTSYPRAEGDPAGSFVARLAEALARRGHEVSAVAAGPGAAEVGGVPVTRVSLGAGLFYGEGAPDRLERDRLAWARAPLFQAALVLAARRLARRCDALLAHWLVPAGVAAALAAPGLPRLAVAHSGDVHLLARAPLADLAIALLLRGGGRLAFVSPHLRDRLAVALRPRARDRLVGSSLELPLGIDVPEAGDRRAARLLLGLDPDRPTVAFLGRLVPVKGAALLLDAVRLLRLPSPQAAARPRLRGTRSQG